MEDDKVSTALALPDHHNQAVRLDRNPSFSHMLPDVAALPEDHNKAASVDHASTCKDATTAEKVSSAYRHYNGAHTPLQIANSKVAPLPLTPASVGKQDHAAPERDVIYKVPPTLPADHPSKAAARKLHRRFSPCTQCIIYLCCLLVAVILLLAIALLVFYFIAHPSLPIYDMDSLTVSELKLTNSTSKVEAATVYVSAAMAMQISLQNSNKMMKVSYTEILEASVRYEGVLISEGSTEASMLQSPGNKTVLQVMAHADMMRMENDTAGSLKDSLPSLPVHVDIQTHVALKLGAWTSRRISVHVGCSVNVTFPATSEFSKSCLLDAAVPFWLLFPTIIF